MSAKYDVFISYRREGGLDAARTVCNELTQRGIRCFFDYNELKTGRFTEGIHEAVRGCAYFLLVLTDGSLTRCCTDADDWVRKEIELALSLGKTIIPVSPSGNARGFPSDLPETMKPLCALQISTLMRDDLFDESVNKIVRERLTGLKRALVRRWWRKAVVVTLALAAIAAGAGVWMMHQRAERRAAEAERIEREAKSAAEAKAAAAAAEAARVKAKAESDALAAEAARKLAEAKRLEEERKRMEEAKAAQERERKLRELAAQKAAEEARKKAEADAAAKLAEAEAEKARIAAAERAAAAKRAEEEAARKKAEEEKARKNKRIAEDEALFDSL